MNNVKRLKSIQSIKKKLSWLRTIEIVSIGVVGVFSGSILKDLFDEKSLDPWVFVTLLVIITIGYISSSWQQSLLVKLTTSETILRAGEVFKEFYLDSTLGESEQKEYVDELGQDAIKHAKKQNSHFNKIMDEVFSNNKPSTE